VLINIQFLRFVAAFLVVLYHANNHVMATGVAQGPIFLVSGALGFAGVDVFFVISGFIMFYTTRGKQGATSSGDFLRRRLARIYSGYWPFFILAAIVFWWARPDHLITTDFLASFLLWPVPMNELLLDVSWTLTYELYFYCLFTVLVLLGVSARWWVLFSTLLCFLIYCICRQWVWQDFSEENLLTNSFANLFLLSPFLAQFFVGAVIARFSHSGTQALGWLLLLAGVAGFIAAGWINVNVYDGNIVYGYYMVARVLLFGAPAAMIVMGLVWLEQHGRVAPARFSLMAGGASYAIYLSHTLFQAATMQLGLNQMLSGLSSIAIETVFLLHSVLIVLFSIGWYLWAERPLNQLFKKVLRVKSKQIS
jgi:peptidoglycan/LPS O-acetylase OafA/YrhL